MVRASNFAEFVAQLSADDKELQKDLKSAETATKSSAEKMQSSLDSVSFSSKTSANNLRGYAGAADKAGQSSQAAARGVSALGAAAAATGSQSLATSSQVAALVASTDELATSLGLVGTTASTALAVFGPLAIAVAAISVAIGLAKSKFDALGESMERTKNAAKAALEPLRQELEILIERNDVRLGLRTQGSADLRQISRETVSHTQAEFDLRLRIHKFKELEAFLAVKAIKDAKSLAGIRKGRALSDRRFLEGLRRQRAEEAAILALEKERTVIAEQERRAQRSEAAGRRAGAVQAAGRLLVGAGALRPEQLIADPDQRRLSILGDRLQRLQEDRERGRISGTFGLRRISGAAGALREGQQLGSRQVTIEQETKELAKQEVEILRDIRAILSRNSGQRVDAGFQLSSPLQTTGAP